MSTIDYIESKPWRVGLQGLNPEQIPWFGQIAPSDSITDKALLQWVPGNLLKVAIDRFAEGLSDDLFLSKINDAYLMASHSYTDAVKEVLSPVVAQSVRLKPYGHQTDGYEDLCVAFAKQKVEPNRGRAARPYMQEVSDKDPGLMNEYDGTIFGDGSPVKYAHRVQFQFHEGFANACQTAFSDEFKALRTQDLKESTIDLILFTYFLHYLAVINRFHPEQALRQSVYMHQDIGGAARSGVKKAA